MEYSISASFKAKEEISICSDNEITVNLFFTNVKYTFPHTGALSAAIRREENLNYQMHIIKSIYFKYFKKVMVS